MSIENDLISRGAVLKLIEDIKENPNTPKNYGTLLDIMREVRNIPTAYDVDKVIEYLKGYEKQTLEAMKLTEECTGISLNTLFIKRNSRLDTIGECIEIIKLGYLTQGEEI